MAGSNIRGTDGRPWVANIEAALALGLLLAALLCTPLSKTTFYGVPAFLKFWPEMKLPLLLGAGALMLAVALGLLARRTWFGRLVMWSCIIVFILIASLAAQIPVLDIPASSRESMARGDRQRMDDKSLQDLRASIELAMWNYRFTGEFASEIAGNRSGGYDMETGSFTAYGMPSWIAIHSPMQDAAWQAQSHVDLIVESNPGALTAHINPFARLPEIPWQQEATMPPPLPVVLNVGVPIVRLGWPRSEPPPVALTGASCIPLAWNECSDNPTDFVVKLLQSHPAGDKKTSAIKIAPNASLNDILRETSLPHAAKGKLAILTFQDPDYTFPGFGGIPRFLSATKYWLVRTLDGRVGILQTIDRRESDRESFSIRWQMIEKGSADTASERK